MLPARVGVCFGLICSLLATQARAEIIAREGQGYLESIQGQLVLHLKGTHREMGYQHGVLLKKQVTSNMNNLIHIKGGQDLVEIGPIKLKPRDAIRFIVGLQQDYVPAWYNEELAGLAEGSGLPPEEITLANFIPELFHCSGFAIMNSATADGTLYHGRVLDYAIDWGLQEHAVVIIHEPEGKIPFVSVSYAGFIGCVTGMNERSISIGEMGGGGLGHWHGMPMAVLMREALQECDTFEKVLDLYRKTPRTCQYFYVVADGKTNQACGMEASWDKMEVIYPGESHELLPHAVKDCALLSAGGRYEELVKRVKEKHGSFTAEDAIRLMDRPVAMSSNLHNVLMEPKTTRFWVSNAGADKTPAANRPYYEYNLRELLSQRAEKVAGN